MNINKINKPAVALMCKSHNYEYQPKTNTFITGDWVISTKRQEELLGENVVLTEGQKDSAYIGGTIVGFVPAKQTSNKKRYDVVFKPESKFVNNKVTRSIEFRGNPVQYL